ncbi:MAG: response regulator [Sphingomonadaceae bacterium]|nr:response regulator [Sphingomonadaceae bacterium]
MDDQLLTGKRVLVVEDEMLVMMAIEDMCADMGCTSVSSAATVEQALAMIDDGPFDLATLDVNLNGDRSYAVADALGAHGIPFAFSTGYGDHGVSCDYRHRPVLNKPYNSRQLTEVLSALLAPLAVNPAAPSAT